MNTAAGKKMAEQRASFLIEFRERLISEIGNSDQQEI
jgi:hypothetical protein